MMNTSDRTISYSHDELMSLCLAYLTSTTVHRVELARIFTQYFPTREKPYLLEDIRNIYKSDGLYNTYIFKRNGLDMMSSAEIKKFVADGFSKEETEIIKKLYDKTLPVSPAFNQILSQNCYEFDIIPEIINSLNTFQADLIIKALVQCDKTFKSLHGLYRLGTAAREELEFFYNVYAAGTDNKRKVVNTIKARYKEDTVFNVQEKLKIANLYLVEGADLLLVKDNIVKFYLAYYNEYKEFKEWYQKVEAVIIAHMSILMPKACFLFKNMDKDEVLNRYDEAVKYTICTFNFIHKQREFKKRLQDVDAKNKPTVGSQEFDICDPEHCEAFHKHKNEVQKRPELHFVITECNLLRIQRLACLREYFALGSFKKQNAFAKSLKENLRPLTDKADLFFEDEEGFKKLCDIYHKGLQRFFWKHENLKQMRADYEELCQFFQENGTDQFFYKDKDVVRIEFKALAKGGLWVEELLDFEYQPARSKDNYNSFIGNLFGRRKFVRIGSQKISVHVIVFLIMFYYWIYLSIEDEASEEIRLCSRCVFHKEIHEQ